MNARNTTMLIMRDISEAEKEKLINSMGEVDIVPFSCEGCDGLKKQRPLRPIQSNYTHGAQLFCAVCGRGVGNDDTKRQNYCSYCGQRLWG